MNKPTKTPYIMILAGLVLFMVGMLVDVAQHGIDFVISEFRHAPLAHGLPLAGILLVVAGALGLRRGLG